jgi:hypothetical protein
MTTETNSKTKLVLSNPREGITNGRIYILSDSARLTYSIRYYTEGRPRRVVLEFKTANAAKGHFTRYVQSPKEGFEKPEWN